MLWELDQAGGSYGVYVEVMGVSNVMGLRMSLWE